MAGDFPLTTSLDQPMVIDVSDLSAEIDNLMSQAIQTGNLDPIIEAGKTLRKAAFLSEFGLVKILHKVQEHWEEFSYGGTWEDLIYVEWGLSKTTVDRYLNVYEMYEVAPQNMLADIQSRPLKDQVAIAAFVATTEVTEEQWKTLVDATTSGDVGQAIADLRGVSRRSNHVKITLDRDGSLYAYPGKRFIGYLNIDDDDEKVKKAINRIVNSADIRKI